MMAASALGLLVGAIAFAVVDAQVYSNNIYRGNGNLDQYAHIFNGNGGRRCRTDHDCGANMHCSVPVCICNDGYKNNGQDSCIMVNFETNCPAGTRSCHFNSDCLSIELCGSDRCCISVTPRNDSSGDHNHTPSPLPGHINYRCTTARECGTNMHCFAGKCICNGGYIANGTSMCQIDRSQLCKAQGGKQCSDHSDCSFGQACGEDHCCFNRITSTSVVPTVSAMFQVKLKRFCSADSECGSNSHCNQHEQRCICNAGYADKDDGSGCGLSNDVVCSYGTRPCMHDGECWFGAACGRDRCCHHVNDLGSSSDRMKSCSLLMGYLIASVAFAIYERFFF